MEFEKCFEEIVSELLIDPQVKDFLNVVLLSETKKAEIIWANMQVGSLLVASELEGKAVNEVIEKAKTCPAHFDGLKHLFAFRLAMGLPRNNQLDVWICNVLTGTTERPPAPKGPRKGIGALRQIFLAALVYEAKKRGLKPTRNMASNSFSGSDAVVRLLANEGRFVSYDKVAKAWSTHAQVWMRDEATNDESERKN